MPWRIKMKKMFLVALMSMLLSVSIFAQVKSIYTGTSVKDCKAAKESSEDGYVGNCPGVGGYKLQLLEGDLRQTINVVSPNKKKFELNLWTVVSGGFSSVGSKVEWRMNGAVPTAIIVRYTVSENPDDSTKLTSYLLVSKISKTSACVVEVIKPSKTQNADAQKSADSAAGKPCKE
jgi:hypothetical protein